MIQIRGATECEAIESFNAHIDCSLVVMNDDCDVETQNLVVEIQEKANDKLIDKRCFDEEDKEEKKALFSSGDGFSLQPKLPACADAQVRQVEVKGSILFLIFFPILIGTS